MAWYDDNQIGDYYAEGIADLDQTEALNDLIFGYGGANRIDHYAEDLFVQAVFEKDKDAYQQLIDYLYDKHGIDFEDAMDWEDFKSWYDSQ